MRAIEENGIIKYTINHPLNWLHNILVNEECEYTNTLLLHGMTMKVSVVREHAISALHTRPLSLLGVFGWCCYFFLHIFVLICLLKYIRLIFQLICYCLMFSVSSNTLFLSSIARFGYLYVSIASSADIAEKIIIFFSLETFFL